MNIHNNFTTIHFLILATVFTSLLFIQKNKKFGQFWDVWVAMISLILTSLLGLYSRNFCSGMYCGNRYGFPRPIFEMSHYIGKDLVDVRVISKMHWDNFLQNFTLIYLLFLNFRLLLK